MNTRMLVDVLGEIKARVAELTAREAEVRAQLVKLGEGDYDGNMYRATVSMSEKHTLDMAAVREKLSPQFIMAHTNATPVTTVRVVACTRARLAA